MCSPLSVVLNYSSNLANRHVRSARRVCVFAEVSRLGAGVLIVAGEYCPDPSKMIPCPEGLQLCISILPQYVDR